MDSLRSNSEKYFIATNRILNYKLKILGAGFIYVSKSKSKYSIPLIQFDLAFLTNRSISFE